MPTNDAVDPAMVALVEQLRIHLCRGDIRRMAVDQGPLVHAFLRFDLEHYPVELQTALTLAAPSGKDLERTKVFYSALEYIIASGAYSKP